MHLHELTASWTSPRSCCSPRSRARSAPPARATTRRPTRSWTRWPSSAAPTACPRPPVAWGPWAGRRRRRAVRMERAERRGGMPRWPPELALARSSRRWTCDETALTVADVEWERFTRGLHRAGRAARCWPTCPRPPRPSRRCRPTRPKDGLGAADLARRLSGLPETERERVLLELVRTAVAAVLARGRPYRVTGTWSRTSAIWSQQLRLRSIRQCKKTSADTLSIDQLQRLADDLKKKYYRAYRD